MGPACCALAVQESFDILAMNCIQFHNLSDGEDVQEGENGVAAPGKKKKKKKKKPAGTKSGDGQGKKSSKKLIDGICVFLFLFVICLQCLSPPRLYM